MRGGVTAGLEAGRAQSALDHGCYRPFAVGARDVDRSICALGMTERRENRADVVESELDAELF
jgi:hypothetical protein